MQGANETCGSVAAGTSYPIVSARGRLRGVLANALPGSTVRVGCGLYRARYLRRPRPRESAGVSAVLVRYPTVTTLDAPATATTDTRVTARQPLWLTMTVAVALDGRTGPDEDEQVAVRGRRSADSW